MRSHRIARRDLPWTTASVAALCGPFDMPSREALLRAVQLLTERYPHCRIGWGWDDARRRWTPAQRDSASEAVVVDGDGLVSALTIGETLDRIDRDTSLRTPLALVRFDRYLGLRMSHAIGDGRTFNEVFASVLQTALTDKPYPWQIGPAVRFPLGSAVARTFGRDPALLRATLADRPHRPTLPPGTPAAWTPARRTLVAVVPADAKRAAMHAAPGASWIAVHMSLLLRALDSAGVPVAQDVSVVVDLRRYLSDDSLDGNFVTGVPFNVDHRHRPEAITAMMRATLRSARPVATQALATMASVRPYRAAPASSDPTRPVRVTFSSVGQPPQIDALPFLPGEPPIYAGGVEPDGPHGLTFLVSETSRASVVSASFHDNVVSADAVQEALTTFGRQVHGHVSHQAVTPWSG
ncbi:hypothetical protein [Mycolicibacterium pyrenivorans]|uniref:hypothetical protein n=1 Tax=Mycolicibacterium pyrenivorans TaxID=187102 RepID=UPI0021F2D774|nr:hypothetical protein [Mycolicibacterium pyrenivorans]MCV7152498.1 hypothetical protein [Mycolicibacterium pyrenivorans]